MRSVIEILIAILLIVIIYFLYEKYNSYNEKYQVSQGEIEEITDEYGQALYAQRQTLVNTQNQMEGLVEENEKLDDINSQLQAKLSAQIPRDTIELTDTMTITRVDTVLYLELPYSFSKFSEWYGYEFTIDSQQVIQDSLYFRSEPTISFGSERTGLFKEKKYVVYQDKNPYVRAKEMENFVLETETSFSLGFHIGYGYTVNGFSPVFSIGLNYKLWNF